MAKLWTALGLMSGTSLDGIDVAVLTTDGERLQEFGPARTFLYSDADRDFLRRALRDAVALNHRDDRPGVLREAEALVTSRHAEAVKTFLAEAGVECQKIDLVGFHGQTVFHDPGRRLTVQLGDGQALADRLRRPVVWDFRADDVAAGGQGAPLVPVYHRALAKTAGLEGPVAFLNIGGVANVTYIGADGDLMAFDTGPGNALLDDFVHRRTGNPFDEDGRLAASGTPSPAILAELLAHPYFRAPAPKSLDRNAFVVPPELERLSDADGAATLLHFTARAVAAGAELLPEPPRAWYLCGGGRHNAEHCRVLAKYLHRACAPARVQALEALGFDGDVTEAQAFAFLAVRAVLRLPLTYPRTTGAGPLSGGRTSPPASAP